jgi:hypothetical protein
LPYEKSSLPRRFMPVFLAANFQLHAQTNSSDLTPQNPFSASCSASATGNWRIPPRTADRLDPIRRRRRHHGARGNFRRPKYRDAMLAKGETNAWQLAEYQGRKYHADDQCYGQVCAELYFLYRDNRMIAPLRAKLDYMSQSARQPKPRKQPADNGRGATRCSWRRRRGCGFTRRRTTRAIWILP